MIRKGTTPAWGIEKAQEGLLISSMEYTPSCETYEQLDHTGEVAGLCLYKQKVEFSMEGEIPYEGDFVNGLGTTIALANELPAGAWLGGQQPTATTMVITGCPISMTREGAQTATVSGVIYPFASEWS